LKITINKTPKSKGSIGKLISLATPGTISLIGIDKGAKKIIIYKSLSKEKRAIAMIIKTKGSRLKK
jgi:hypothetical protein